MNGSTTARAGALSAVVALLLAGCASAAGSSIVPTAVTTVSAAAGPASSGALSAPSVPASSGPATSEPLVSDPLASGPATAVGSASSGSPQPGPASAASSAPAPAAALPASAPGDRQKPADLMAAVAPSGLPLHKTADLGGSSRVYQAVAGKYGDVLADLSATGYGDAESTASSFIVVLGQLKPVRPLPNTVDGTLAALGATKVVAQTRFGAHAAKYGLVLSCGTLPNGHPLCAWAGGTNGDLFLGAVEAPVGMSRADAAALAESVFGYVTP